MANLDWAVRNYIVDRRQILLSLYFQCSERYEAALYKLPVSLKDENEGGSGNGE